MRDYGKVAARFWIGNTGKKLRGCTEAQVVATYLITSPHANMLGLYYLPQTFLRHETGLTSQGASKGLRRCIDAQFCAYDEASEVVWVFEMARFQVAEQLKADDKRCRGMQSEYDKLPENQFLSDFFDKYALKFHLTRKREKKGFLKAPSKGLRSQEQEQYQEQYQEQEKELLSDSPKSDLLTVIKSKAANLEKSVDILTHLNNSIGAKFRTVPANLNLIVARLASATAEEIKAVIDAKVTEWKSDPKMCKYLRPETLFNASKFEQYRGQVGSAPPPSTIPSPASTLSAHGRYIQKLITQQLAEQAAREAEEKASVPASEDGGRE